MYCIATCHSSKSFSATSTSALVALGCCDCGGYTRFPQNGWTASPVRKMCRSANCVSNIFECGRDVDGIYCTYVSDVFGISNFHNNTSISVGNLQICTPYSPITSPLKAPPFQIQTTSLSILPSCIHPLLYLDKRSANFHDAE